MEEGGVA